MPRKHGVRFALEALNRFECYFLNTMDQLASYLDELDHPAVKGMFDTFHANIEEKDLPAAIKKIKRHMIHVHISENDRGTPGKGHVPWAETYKALRAAKYDGRLDHRGLRPRNSRRWPPPPACGATSSPTRRRSISSASST